MNIPLRKLTKKNLKDFTLQDLRDLCTYLNEDFVEVRKNYRACSERDIDKHKVYERKMKKIEDNIDLVRHLIWYKLYPKIKKSKEIDYEIR